MATKRINLISGPRNISTALMYSFANRKDTTVVDEPMYAYYLHATGKNHPGREEVLSSLPKDVSMVKKQLMYADVPTPLYFIKGMAHHYMDQNLEFLLDFVNVFLIRDLKKLILSFSKVIATPTLQDIGIKKEFEIFEFLKKAGQKPIILDSDSLLDSPEEMLKTLCAELGIPFDKAMLNWSPGPIPEDGLWAKYWYKSVHISAGFEKKPSYEEELPERLTPLYREALPYYEELYLKRLKLQDVTKV